MDPNAALERIRELLVQLDATDDSIDLELVSEQLAQAVSGLDDWLVQGGFLPAEWRVNREDPNAQANALARLLEQRNAAASVHPGAFDLPDGYWRVQFADGFECGIAPDGSVSS